MGGVAVISHEQEYGTLECAFCKREFILLSVIRNQANDTAVIEQPEFDVCPFCGKRNE